MFLSTAGMVTGLDFIMFKAAGEAMKAGASWHSAFVLCNWVGAMAISALVLWCVNLGMQLYNNIEVQVIFKAMNVVW